MLVYQFERVAKLKRNCVDPPPLPPLLQNKKKIIKNLPFNSEFMKPDL